MLKYILSFTIVIITFNAFAQDVLSLDAAIKKALEKNYSVLITKNELEVAKAQNNFGNAGMSPQVSLNGGLGGANLNSYQEFSSGVVQERNGAQSNNANASVNVNWVVFDGLKMFAVKKRLYQNEQLSAAELKQQMENTIYDVVVAYYDIVRINQLINAAKQNLSIYAERKKIAQLKYEIGSDSKVDLLLTQADENKSKSTLLQLELQLLKAKSKLNTLMNEPIDADFKATDSIEVVYNPSLDELKKSIITSNSSVLISKQNELIARLSIKEARSANLPFVQLNAAYNFTRSQSQAGFVFLNRQMGLNAGVTAGWLLFNGGKNSKLVKERNLLYLNQKYRTEQAKQIVDAQVYMSFKAFELNKQIVDLEKQNLTDSKDVLNVSLERYRVGKTNLLETIETQKNLEDAQTRYIDALYNIKIAETELLKANGSLVK